MGGTAVSYQIEPPGEASGKYQVEPPEKPPASLWDRTKAGASEMYHHPLSALSGVAKGTLAAMQGALPQGETRESTPEETAILERSIGPIAPVAKWNDAPVRRLVGIATEPQNDAERAGFVTGSQILPAASMATQLGRGLTGNIRASQARGLGKIPTPPTAPPAETGEALASIPVATERPIARPINVRGPGEIPAEQIRPRALSPRAPAEPIPPREGGPLLLNAAPEPPSIRRTPGQIAPEMTRPRAYYGGPRPEPIPAREGLLLKGNVETPAPIDTSRLGPQLKEAVGDKPIAMRPGIPIGRQPDVVKPLPGFTPVESSAMRAYRWDPEVREMSIQTGPGRAQIYAEVSPEAAQKFIDAPSKGKAWPELKANSTPVAKLVNGERQSLKPVIAGADLNPKNAAAPKVRIGRLTTPSQPLAATDDLTPQLRASLRNVRLGRLGQQPAALDVTGKIPTTGETPLGEPAGRLGTERQGEAVPGPRSPSTPPARGAATDIRVPGENRSYRAAYQVRELADVHPSHSGETFQPNPKYNLVNDRDYSNQVNQGKILSAQSQFDPAYHITDNQDATNGPIAVDSDGNALGGNGRAMILQRVYRYNPDAATAYKDLLTRKAAQFGLDPADIARMKQPVLVREIPDRDLAPNEKQAAITDFNKKGTAELTPAERAIADSRRLSPETLDHIATRLDQAGPDASLANVLSGSTGTEILDRLIRDGALTPQERAAFATESGLTDAGKDRISKLMVGRFFDDPAQLDAAAPALRGKLEKLAAPLARIEGVPGWDITPTVREAVQILEEMRTHGVTLDDLIRQRGLFGESKYSAEAVAMAEQLKETPGNALAKSARQYAADAFDSQRPLLLGEPVSPNQAFQEAFKPKSH